MNKRMTVVLSAGGAFVLLAVACNQLPTKDPSALLKTGGDLAKDLKDASKDMTYNEEREVGQTVALQAYANPDTGAPVRRQDVMNFVNLMAAAIARNSDRPNIPYHIAIVDRPEVNAFSAPGGYIFLTKGLVASCDSEAELAFVVAHEIAHVAHKHALKAIQKGKQVGALMKGASSAAGGSGYAEFDKFVQDAVKSVTGSAFDRTLETDADVKALNYMYATGYDPRAAYDFLAKLEAKQRDKSLLGAVAATHPAPADRKGTVDATIKGWDLTTSVKNTPRFADIKTALAGPQEKWPI